MATMESPRLNPIAPASEETDASTRRHLHGVRLLLVTILNATMLFLVQIEIFIVTTSLVAITEELGDFDTSSWILASYFLGYVSKYFILVPQPSNYQ